MWRQPPRLFRHGEARRNTQGSGSCDRGSYFKLNSAFTCAVTVTVWGVNSSVGAGVAAAMADMVRAICGMTILGFSKVSTEAYESSPRVRPLARASVSAELRARRYAS